ncbi:MAG: glycosyltransferase family 2 protein [Pseudomonadota bacterium]
MNNNPILSIILPVYNTGKYIHECIASILNQTFKDFELIICDDCSTDNSLDIISSLKDDRIILSHNSINLGKTKTVNRLLSITKGKYITIHDSDDWSDVERFKKQIDWMDKNKHHVMCGTGFLSYNLDREIVGKFIPLTSYTDIESAIDVQGQFHGPTMLFRKSAIRGDDYIYRSYFINYCEDTDLAYRLFQKGICTNINEPLYFYRILPNSLCRKEFTVKNKHLYRVVVHLAKQRKKNGVDDLMQNNAKAVDDYFASITYHYKKDKGLIYREGASYYMYFDLYSRAIYYSIKAIIYNPIGLLNWRTLFYCCRKGLNDTLKNISLFK